MYWGACVIEQESKEVRTAMSEARDPETVAQDLARQLIHPHLGFVLFFCSAEYDLPALGTALHQYCALIFRRLVLIFLLTYESFIMRLV